MRGCPNTSPGTLRGDPLLPDHPGGASGASSGSKNWTSLSMMQPVSGSVPAPSSGFLLYLRIRVRNFLDRGAAVVFAEELPRAVIAKDAQPLRKPPPTIR